MAKQYPTKQYLSEVISNREFAESVPPEIVIVMARQLLAGIEQEPMYQACKEAGVWVDIEPDDVDSLKANGEQIRPLYAAPQLPQPAVPETLPCPVMLEPGFRFGKGVRTQTMLDALQRRAEYYAELEAMTPEQRADHDAGMKEFAAVLQGAKSGERLGAEFEESLTDLIDAEMEPTCWCLTCRPVTMTDMRFVVCPKCGNKRCPHANDHRNACTGSNEPGQEGSAYPAAPQQEVK